MDQYRSSFGLWRLSAAAIAANLSDDMLARACERGEIPVTLVKIGPRLRFVKAAEFTAWLAGAQQTKAAHAPAAEENLFGGVTQ